MDALALRAARVRAREVDLEALDVAAEPVALRAEVADLRHEDGRVRGEGLAPRRLGPRRLGRRPALLAPRLEHALAARVEEAAQVGAAHALDGDQPRVVGRRVLARVEHVIRARPHQEGHGEAAEPDGVGGGGGGRGAHDAVRAGRVVVAAEEGKEVAHMHLRAQGACQGARPRLGHAR